MHYKLVRVATLGGILGVAALAGCAGSGSNQMALPTAAQNVASAMAVHQPIQNVVPDTCVVPVTQPIKKVGGVITLPKCGGFAGQVGYPSNNAPMGAKTTVTTYDDAMTLPPSGGYGTPSGGTVIAWVSSVGNSNGIITFCNYPTCPLKMGTLTSKKLKKLKTYSLYVFAGGSQQGSPLALGSPHCTRLTCKLGPFPSPLTGQSLPQFVTFWFELAVN